jgi:hypothetical protein
MSSDLFFSILVIALISIIVNVVLNGLKDRWTVRYQIGMALSVNQAVLDNWLADDDEVDDTEEYLKTVPDLINPPD